MQFLQLFLNKFSFFWGGGGNKSQSTSEGAPYPGLLEESHLGLYWLSYTSNNNKISELEGFNHKMLKFPSLINFPYSEIDPFGCSERKSLIILSAISLINSLNDDKPPFFDWLLNTPVLV